MSEGYHLKLDTGVYTLNGSAAKQTVQRSGDSWAFFRSAFLLAFSIVVAMVSPLIGYSFKPILILLLVLITGWAILRNERVQNWLVRVRTWLEKGRPH